MVILVVSMLSHVLNVHLRYILRGVESNFLILGLPRTRENLLAACYPGVSGRLIAISP